MKGALYYLTVLKRGRKNKVHDFLTVTRNRNSAIVD